MMQYLNDAIRQYLDAHDNFSVWDMTQYLRTLGCNFLDSNDRTYAVPLRHDETRRAFREMFDNDQFNLDEQWTENEQGIPYRVYSHRNATASTAGDIWQSSAQPKQQTARISTNPAHVT